MTTPEFADDGLLPLTFVSPPYQHALNTLVVPQWIKDTEGWISDGELTILAYAASQIPAGQRIVELGTYRGKSALAMAFGSRNGAAAPIYTIDPHTVQKGMSGELYGPQDMVALYYNLSRAPDQISSLVHCIGLPGADAARAFPENSVGLLFIDALHDTSSVIADWLAWQHTLTDNATVGFHDSNYLTVQRAISSIQTRGYILRPIVKGGSIMIHTFSRPL